MATAVEATAILCDAAQAAEGKLYVMGGGWTRLAAQTPAPIALAILIHVPYDMTNKSLKIKAALLDDDGNQVEIEGNPVQGLGEFELGRPPGTKQGEQLTMPIVMNFQGLALDQGGYVFECSIQDEEVARCPFRVI